MRTLLVVISAAYILWLAYRVATAPPLSSQPTASAAPSLVGGTVLGVANPKAWVAIGAVFVSAHLADAAATDAASKIGLLTAMIILICGTWLIAGALLTRLLRDPHVSRIINWALAAALVGATALAIFH
jgi:threonine/homoserine/homoserine lactone efflux protein